MNDRAGRYRGGGAVLFGLVLAVVALGCPADVPQFPPSADGGTTVAASTSGLGSSSDGTTTSTRGSETGEPGSGMSSDATGEVTGSEGSIGVCGDGIVDVGEVCDGSAVGGQSCESQGFAGGPLGCSETCESLDTSGCWMCGNGIVEAREACDGPDLGGQTCTMLGYDEGTLVCSSRCDFDVSACCMQAGNLCDSDAGCCVGLACSDGQCCAFSGQDCSNNGTCCSGLCFAGPGQCA